MMPLPVFSLLILKKYWSNKALTAIEAISSKSALAKKTNLCIRYQEILPRIPGASIPTPSPINTESLTRLNIKCPGVQYRNGMMCR